MKRTLRPAGLSRLVVTLTVVLATAAPAGAGDGEKTHEVRRRETVNGIARQYGISARDLVTANHLGSTRTRLQPGKMLTIPERPAAPDRSRGDRATVQVSASRAVASSAGVRARRVSVRGGRGLDIFASAPPGLVLAVLEFEGAVPVFVWPVEGAVSSSFGRRQRGWHRGVDILALPGAPIVAAAAGVVVASGFEPRYGRVVKLEHEGGFLTVYAHNQDNLVQVGDPVAAGQGIATVGQTGHATGPHLHFEIRQGDRSVNPLYLLPFPPRVSVEETGHAVEDEDE